MIGVNVYLLGWSCGPGNGMYSCGRTVWTDWLVGPGEWDLGLGIGIWDWDWDWDWELQAGTRES